jgi:hypothetical protein
VPKLIFIACVPVGRIFGEKVDPSWYSDHGFDVECWDLVSLFYEKARIEAYFSGAANFAFELPGRRVFTRKRDVAAALQALPKDAIVFHLSRISSPIVDDYWLLRLFRRYRVPYAIQELEIRSNRTVSAIDGLSAKIRHLASKAFSGEGITAARLAMKDLLFRHTDYYRKPAIAVGMGGAGRQAFSPLLAKGVEFISIPSPTIDWDEGTAHKAECCVFVDESIGHAPDGKLLGYETVRDLDAYYRDLKHVFALVEAQTGQKVIVAASGKVTYETNPFDREVVYRQTKALSQRATLVIGHASTGMLQAIYNKKPILLLDAATFTETKRNHVRLFASTFGLRYHRADTVTPDVVRGVLDSRVSDSYIEKLFCERGVAGDYRAIIAGALRRHVTMASTTST